MTHVVHAAVAYGVTSGFIPWRLLKAGCSLGDAASPSRAPSQPPTLEERGCSVGGSHAAGGGCGRAPSLNPSVSLRRQGRREGARGRRRAEQSALRARREDRCEASARRERRRAHVSVGGVCVRAGAPDAALEARVVEDGPSLPEFHAYSAAAHAALARRSPPVRLRSQLAHRPGRAVRQRHHHHQGLPRHLVEEQGRDHPLPRVGHRRGALARPAVPGRAAKAKGDGDGVQRPHGPGEGEHGAASLPPSPAPSQITTHSLRSRSSTGSSAASSSSTVSRSSAPPSRLSASPWAARARLASLTARTRRSAPRSPRRCRRCRCWSTAQWRWAPWWLRLRGWISAHRG